MPGQSSWHPPTTIGYVNSRGDVLLGQGRFLRRRFFIWDATREDTADHFEDDLAKKNEQLHYGDN